MCRAYHWRPSIWATIAANLFCPSWLSLQHPSWWLGRHNPPNLKWPKSQLTCIYLLSRLRIQAMIPCSRSMGAESESPAAAVEPHLGQWRCEIGPNISLRSIHVNTITKIRDKVPTNMTRKGCCFRLKHDGMRITVGKPSIFGNINMDQSLSKEKPQKLFFWEVQHIML